jgi:hypothetical protein
LRTDCLQRFQILAFEAGFKKKKLNLNKRSPDFTDSKICLKTSFWSKGLLGIQTGFKRDFVPTVARRILKDVDSSPIKAQKPFWN